MQSSKGFRFEFCELLSLHENESVGGGGGELSVFWKYLCCSCSFPFPGARWLHLIQIVNALK